MSPNQLLIDLLYKRFEGKEKPEYVSIFGAGKNGLYLKDFLQKSNVTVNFFSDNDPGKQGSTINGIPCLSIEELSHYKQDLIVFVSPYHSKEILDELERREFPVVISSDFLRLARFIPTSENENYLKHIPHFGHYYSLYPDIDEIMSNSEEVFNSNRTIHDINLNEEEQLYYLREMVKLYNTAPNWVDQQDETNKRGLRYRLGNPSLSAGDAMGLHTMLRIIKPKKVIEVGSGYTSAVTLDTNEFYMDSQMDLTFIEPFPNLLLSLLKEKDKINLFEKKLQDVPVETFKQLENGDILFIDSTHVSKINSDVNYLFFEILPKLKKGVFVHLHDIFYPFEYPKHWIQSGIIWNELYLLRAFLQNNKDYKIVFFQNMMEQLHKDVFTENWPLNTPIHGGSIWLKKL